MNSEGQGGQTTWYQTGKLESNKDFSVETLQDIAKEFYEYVIDKPNARTSSTNACIVAVFGDRQTPKFTASTIPWGPVNARMGREGRQKAPLWYHQMQTRNRLRSSGGEFHAEDGAMFRWESSPDSHGRTGHGVYLNDPIMGVYGDPGFRNPGVKDLNPCEKCLPVVGALDIGYHDSNGGRSSPTYSDGIDDEDMMEVDCWRLIAHWLVLDSMRIDSCNR